MWHNWLNMVQIGNIPELSLAGMLPSTDPTLSKTVAMPVKTVAMFVTAGLSLLAVMGDYFLKRASDLSSPMRTAWFLIGFVIYASMVVLLVLFPHGLHGRRA